MLGPNGSGKSNILDALTFVLGKSSSKALRAEKSANLIYNGGKQKDPAKQAEVSIFFDNSKKEFPSEEKEVKITRIVTKSGQSKYKINDKSRTRQQILDLMGLAKINPDGYNIVLQQEIINFCNMTSVARRQLIEDISGISVYEEKKQKALRDLEKVDTNIKEADIVLTERETYLKELKKDRDQAIKYQEMSKKVDQNKATLLNLKIKKRKEENQKSTKQLEDLKESLKKMEQEIADLRKKNEEKKKAIDDINKEIEEKGEKEQVEMNRQVEHLKIEMTKNNSRMSHLESEIIKIDTRKKDLTESMKDIDSKVKNVADEIKDLEKQKKTLVEDKQKVETRIAEFRKKHKLDNANELDKEIDDLEKVIEEKSKEALALREQQQESIRKKDQLEFQLRTIDEKIDKVAQIETEHKDELEKVKKKRQEFKQTTLKLNDLLGEDSKASAELVGARKELLVANERLGELRAKENAVKHSISADLAIKKILELKSRMPGIYETVAELGNVSSEHALALEIAAGIRIKGIVVESDQVAAECIKYLRQNKLGTVTFLPLNKMRGPDEQRSLSELKKTPGVVGSAIELVQFDPKFKNVFSYVFGNTLVVETIDVARKVGIGKAKMVSLAGDYADISGAMQGGFRQKKKSGMSFREDQLTKQVTNQEEHVSKLSHKISVYEKKKEQLEEDIIRLRNFKAELEGDIIKAERSLHIGDSDLETSMKDKKELARELDSVDKELRQTQMTISKTNSDLAQQKIKRQQFKDQVMQLRSPTLIAELNTFEQKRGELSEELIKIESQITGATGAKGSMFATEKENISRLIKQLDREKEDFQIEMKELKELNKIKEKDLKVKETAAKKFYESFKALFTKRTKISDEMNTNDVKINTKVQKSREIEIKTNTLTLTNAKIIAELAGLEEEFQQYKDIEILRSVDEDHLKREIYRFEKLRQEIGNVNMKALEIYDTVAKEYEQLLEKKSTLEKEKTEVEQLIAEIDTNKKELFMKNFTVINDHFKKIFVTLSTKGNAYMLLENPEDPFEAGVLIKVKISGNKYMDIKSLSGGEKTMTALAFIFAIQEHDPAEFYIFDEVDAALDKKNSEKLAELVNQYADRAQYIIISHNDSVISSGDTLFGISMDANGISKATSLKI